MSKRLTRSSRAYEHALAPILAALLSLAVLARGAHDLWAATAVYIAVFLLSAGLLYMSAYHEQTKGIFRAFRLPASLLLIALTVSTLLSIHPAESLLRLLDAFTALLLLWLALHALHTEADCDRFLMALVPIVCIQTGMILHQQATGVFFHEQPAGMLVHSDIAAAFFILWLPPLADKTIKTWSTPSPMRHYWRTGLTAAFTGLIFVYSAWAIICVALFLPFAAGPKKTKALIQKHPRTAAALLLLSLSIIIGATAYKFSGAAEESTRRIGWWQSSWRMFRAYPWFGVGNGNYPSAYLAFQAGGQHTRFAHSLPLSLLAEIGIIGFSAAALLLLSWISHIFQPTVLQKRWPYILSVAAFLTFSLIGLSVEYWVNLAALTICMAAAAAPAVALRVKPRRITIIAVCAATIGAIPFIIAPFSSSQRSVFAQERLRLQDIDIAEKAYADAANLDPLSSEAQRGWARTLYTRAQVEGDKELLKDAVRHQRRAAELNILQGVLWWELGAYLREQGDIESAQTFLKKAQRLDPGHPAIRGETFMPMPAQMPKESDPT